MRLRVFLLTAIVLLLPYLQAQQRALAERRSYLIANAAEIELARFIRVAARKETPPLPSAKPKSDNIFDGGPESLAAKAIGTAEGTRTPEGHRTHAYYGHNDPGNSVWNLGSFSYQHGASSPEAADAKQLIVLKNQAQILDQKAGEKQDLVWGLAEKLNGLDLANQAPDAALGEDGYVDWLNTAYLMGFKGHEAILYARARSFLDPDSGQWNAPGLGNTLHSIHRDQERRMFGVLRAIAIHTGDAPPSRKVVFPIAGKTIMTATLTSDYGIRSDPFTKEKTLHNGRDYSAPLGTPAIATEDATVNRVWFEQDGGGNVVEIIPKADPTITLKYLHLDRVTVRESQSLKQGEQLGTVGSTGRSTNPHLHFGVQSNTGNGWLHPGPYMNRMFGQNS